MTKKHLDFINHKEVTHDVFVFEDGAVKGEIPLDMTIARGPSAAAPYKKMKVAGASLGEFNI